MNCGCNPIDEPFEFEIVNPIYINNSKIELPYGNDCDLYDLKDKVIEDYYDIIKKLECGIRSDLEIILEEISILDMNNSCSYNTIKKIYSSSNSNNEEYDNFTEDSEYLKRNNYLSEYLLESEKNKVLDNLGLLNKLTEHIILSEEEYAQLDNYKDNAIYFVTE